MATERIDRTRKLRIYAREGVPHAWLLNPSLRTLEALRLESGPWVVAGSYDGEQVVRADPFADVGLELSRLWS